MNPYPRIVCRSVQMFSIVFFIPARVKGSADSFSVNIECTSRNETTETSRRRAV